MISNQCKYKCDIHRKYLKIIINYIIQYTHIYTYCNIYVILFFITDDICYMKKIINYYLLNILYKLFFIILNV